MDAFKIEGLLGKGSSGKVYKVTDQNMNTSVIKTINLDPETGLSQHAVREIKTLKKLKSKYIISLYSIIAVDNCVNLNLEYLPFSLEYLISSKFIFSDDHFHSIMYQLINAVGFIHSKSMIHRDLKPSHVLLDHQCNLKIIDFGMAREQTSNMTNKAVSLHYRAPEILLGDTEYTNKVDSWAAACILLEIKKGEPIFKGEDEVSQCKLILSAFGKPEIEYPWDELFNVDKYAKPTGFDAAFESKFGHLVDDKTLLILKEMMYLDKNRRISMVNLTKLSLLKKNENIKCTIEHKLPDML